MKPLFRLLFSLAFIFLSADSAWAATCCGGGFAAASLISGDEKAQLTTSVSATEIVIDNVDSNGLWRRWDDHQRVVILNIQGAHIFQDRFQAGFNLPIIERSHLGQSDSGLADINLSLGYEYLPDWNYNPYRPKGIGFFQLTLPTGRSKYNSQLGGLDSRGNGTWALGLGTLLTKSWSRWDAFTLLEVHHSFANQNSSGTMGGNWGAGLGYNLSNYRWGSSITWTQENIERYATAAVSISYLASSEWSGTLNLNDQTLFGSPQNTSLGRGVSLQIQRRFPR